MAIDVFRAAQEGQEALLRRALEEDPDLAKAQDKNSVRSVSCRLSRTQDDRTALHHACSSGHLGAVQALLDHHADPNACDGAGFTPFISAVSAGQIDIVKALLGAGADVKIANAKGLTPLHYAASKGRTELGRLLLEKGADVNALDSAKQLPLHRAASIGAVPFINLLVQQRPPPAPKTRLNTADRAQNTPLHLAMESGHAEAAVALIRAGADRERQNSDNQRPEEVDGVLGEEQKRARQYVVSQVGQLD